MEPEGYQPENYRFFLKDEQKWKEYLKTHGFVVIKGAIPEKEIKKAVQGMKETLCNLSDNLDIDDESTWNLAKNYPMLLHGGMIQYVGHAQFQWDLRELVAPIYAKVWDVKETELATSFDGFCYMHGNRKYQERDMLSFVHTDQAPCKNYYWCVQGLVSLFDNGEEDGGLVVIPKTHLKHHDFFKKLKLSHLESDWYKFSDEEKKDAIFKGGIKVCGEKGDFMMWDSRTFHCNTVPTRKTNGRACVYIC
mmetsp:Transcript_33789/g.30617  ORF Transcript_33789/g.30617 Transcript_33789/m.30617 type:complete len:249 (+) Transcript_33789:65-811(+)